MCRMISVRCDGARLLTDIAGDLRERFDFAVFWFHEKCELDPNSLMDRPSSFSPTMRPEPSRFWKLYATPLMQFPTPSMGERFHARPRTLRVARSRTCVWSRDLSSLRAQRSNPSFVAAWIASSLRSSQ